MVVVNYQLNDGILMDEENIRLSYSMDRAHFIAERALVSSDHDVSIYDGEVHAGHIPILLHKSRGDVRARTQRSLKLIRKDRTGVYLLSYPLVGSLFVEQNSHATRILPGSFALTRTNAPVVLDTLPNEDREHMSIHVLVPSSLVTTILLDPWPLCGLGFQFQHSGAHVAQRLLSDLYVMADSMDVRAAQSLATAAIEAMLLAAENERSVQCRQVGKRERSLRKLLDYIALHCFDPDMSTQKVAVACGISTRYMNDLLRRDGKIFKQYLWQTRLANAREQLKDRRFAGRPISEVAYLVGFKSNSHFSRAFKAAFGMSPRIFRNSAHLGSADELLAAKGA